MATDSPAGTLDTEVEADVEDEGDDEEEVVGRAAARGERRGGGEEADEFVFEVVALAEEVV